MSLNQKCPKCGSTKVRLTTEKNKHNFLWFILLGWFWVLWWFCKLLVAFFVLVYFDWWYYLIQKSQNRGYIWLSKRIIQNKSKTFYCENCNHNFRG